MYGFSVAGFVCSKGPLSRVESGAKPPGGSDYASPRTPSLPLEQAERLYAGRLRCRGLPEFPLSAEAILCKVTALFLCGLSDSRRGLRGGGGGTHVLTIEKLLHV